MKGIAIPCRSRFIVLATQNPVEYQGTYPLPEAPVDRFLFKTIVGYPALEAEADILRRYHQGFDAHRLADVGLTPVLTPDDLAELRCEIDKITVEDGILTYITKLSDATRRAIRSRVGSQPARLDCNAAFVKRYAALQGRNYVVPDDVKMIALPFCVTASYSNPKQKSKD